MLLILSGKNVLEKMLQLYIMRGSKSILKLQVNKDILKKVDKNVQLIDKYKVFTFKGGRSRNNKYEKYGLSEDKGSFIDEKNQAYGVKIRLTSE